VLIELDQVSVVRATTRILDQISLQIALGEHCAILGPNGSGKSTLLKLLLRYMYPSVVDGKAGTVRILGQENWNVWDMRTEIGFISSDVDRRFTSGRASRLTALQAVFTGYSASELEPDETRLSESMKLNALHWLSYFGMDERSAQTVQTMSTGERRRVLLARAMVLQPKALVFDEPTSGLDLVARSRFLDSMQRLAEQGTQIILVTHHLEELIPCLQRVILLKGGRIFLDAQASQEISSSTISSLFDHPIDVFRREDGFLATKHSFEARPASEAPST
jgi:iron complex transport system ATP-binding protein